MRPHANREAQNRHTERPSLDANSLAPIGASVRWLVFSGALSEAPVADRMPSGETEAMSLPGPWYTKPWRRLASGRRAVLGVWCYLGAAVLCVMLAAFSDAATATRIGWTVIGAVWAFIGASLLATLRHRTRSTQQSDT